MTKAIRYVRAMETGYTRPHLFECDDGDHYVVKFMSNPQGIRALAKELIAYRLGRMLDLPVVYGTVIELKQDIIDQNRVLQKQNVQPGPHFGSLFIENTQPFSSKAIRSCVNLHQAAGMIVFDTWLHNKDRPSGNILITQSSRPKFIMIDHQGIFGGASWRQDDLKRYRNRVKPLWTSLYSRLVEFIDDKDNPFEEELEKLESCSRSAIAKATLGLPKEWGISEEELDVLIEYLYCRKRLVREALKELKEHFPK